MNKYLLLLFFFSVTSILRAQNHSFDYHRKGKSVQMISDEMTISFGDYKSLENGSKERLILWNDASYRLIIQGKESNKTKTILSPKDSILATVFLSGDNRNNIILPDGRVLNRVQLDEHRWSYQKDGENFITYTTRKDRKYKGVTIQFKDSTIPVDVFEIVCLEHSAKVLYSSSTALIIGTALGLALLRAAIGSGG